MGLASLLAYFLHLYPIFKRSFKTPPDNQRMNKGINKKGAVSDYTINLIVILMKMYARIIFLDNCQINM